MSSAKVAPPPASTSGSAAPSAPVPVPVVSTPASTPAPFVPATPWFLFQDPDVKTKPCALPGGMFNSLTPDYGLPENPSEVFYGPPFEKDFTKFHKMYPDCWKRMYEYMRMALVDGVAKDGAQKAGSAWVKSALAIPSSILRLFPDPRKVHEMMTAQGEGGGGDGGDFYTVYEQLFKPLFQSHFGNVQKGGEGTSTFWYLSDPAAVPNTKSAAKLCEPRKVTFMPGQALTNVNSHVEEARESGSGFASSSKGGKDEEKKVRGIQVRVRHSMCPSEYAEVHSLFKGVRKSLDGSFPGLIFFHWCEMQWLQFFAYWASTEHLCKLTQKSAGDFKMSLEMAKGQANPGKTAAEFYYNFNSRGACAARNLPPSKEEQTSIVDWHIVARTSVLFNPSHDEHKGPGQGHGGGSASSSSGISYAQRRYGPGNNPAEHRRKYAAAYQYAERIRNHPSAKINGKEWRPIEMRYPNGELVGIVDPERPRAYRESWIMIEGHFDLCCGETSKSFSGLKLDSIRLLQPFPAPARSETMALEDFDAPVLPDEDEVGGGPGDEEGGGGGGNEKRGRGDEGDHGFVRGENKRPAAHSSGASGMGIEGMQFSGMGTGNGMF